MLGADSRIIELLDLEIGIAIGFLTVAMETELWRIFVMNYRLDKIYRQNFDQLDYMNILAKTILLKH